MNRLNKCFFRRFPWLPSWCSFPVRKTRKWCRQKSVSRKFHQLKSTNLILAERNVPAVSYICWWHIRRRRTVDTCPVWSNWTKLLKWRFVQTMDLWSVASTSFSVVCLATDSAMKIREIQDMASSVRQMWNCHHFRYKSSLNMLSQTSNCQILYCPFRSHNRCYRFCHRTHDVADSLFYSDSCQPIHFVDWLWLCRRSFFDDSCDLRAYLRNFHYRHHHHHLSRSPHAELFSARSNELMIVLSQTVWQNEHFAAMIYCCYRSHDWLNRFHLSFDKSLHWGDY